MKITGKLCSVINRINIKYPGMTALAGTLCGIVLCGDYGLLRWLMSGLIVAFLLLLPRFRAVIFMLFFAAGMIAVWLNNYINHSTLPEIGNGMLEAKVIDAACGGMLNRWLPNPALTTVKPVRYQIEHSKWVDVQGKVALLLPRNKQRLRYGDIVRLQGSWQLMSENPSIHVIKLGADGRISRETERHLKGFNFKHYLRVHGISRCFRAKKITVVGHKKSFFATIMAWRNALLAASVEGIKSDLRRGMLAALLFGCKQGLPRNSRHAFVYSGTIHIFTVSGLHVGMLALLLLWGLRWVSFSTRHLMIPGLLLVYVVSTGMHPPALRAWLMITVWCICRSMLLHTPTLNIVIMAAVVLLLVNPLYMQDAGFQFSFIVVGFLVASAGRINRFLQLLLEKWHWIPSDIQPLMTVQSLKLFRLMLASLTGCMVAWLASSGLVLYYQGVYVPMAITANFLIMPLVWILFVLVFFRFMAIIITFMIPLINGMLTFTINSTLVISGFFSHCFGSIPTPRPTFCSLIVFYCSAAGLITCKKRLTLAGAMLGMALMLIYWHGSALLAESSMLIIHGGGSQEPLIALCNPSRNMATVLNVPSWQSAGIIIDCLRDKGIARIDRLIICGSGRKFCSGALRLLKKMDIKLLIVPDSRRSNYLRSLVKAAVEHNVGVIQLHKSTDLYELKRSDLILKLKKTSLSIDYHDLSGNIKVGMSNNGLGTRIITVGGEHHAPFKLKLINSSKTAVTELMAHK